MKTIIAWLAALCLLAACGSADEGPELGEFPALTKKEGDEPFKLSAPSSKSPAPFSFSSSNGAVAIIVGDMVTIKGAGESTITAAQERIGSYGPTSKSTTLTVTAVACETGKTRVDGLCVPIPTCVSPAIVNNNKCTAPASAAASVAFGGRTWMGVTTSDTWANASKFCESVIDGVAGWRQPTAAELSELLASGTALGPNWVRGNTWTSEMGTTAAIASHVTVNLDTGARGERGDSTGSLVSCVR